MKRVFLLASELTLLIDALSLHLHQTVIELKEACAQLGIQERRLFLHLEQERLGRGVRIAGIYALTASCLRG